MKSIIFSLIKSCQNQGNCIISEQMQMIPVPFQKMEIKFSGPNNFIRKAPLTVMMDYCCPTWADIFEDFLQRESSALMTLHKGRKLSHFHELGIFSVGKFSLAFLARNNLSTIKHYEYSGFGVKGLAKVWGIRC